MGSVMERVREWLSPAGSGVAGRSGKGDPQASLVAALGEHALEVKRLRRVVAQQKYTLEDNLKKYFKLKDALRDAEVYISVLEHENEMFQQQISDLQNGGDSNA